MSARSTNVGGVSRQGHRRALRQQVRVYSPELARAVYDALMELGAPEHERDPFQGYLCQHHNDAPWHFAKGRGAVLCFKPTSCQVEMHWKSRGQPPKNFEGVNKKLAEIRKDAPLTDLKRLGP